MKNSQKGISRKKREYLHIDRRLYRTVKIAFYGEPSEEDEAPLKESAEPLEGDEKPSERGGGIPAEEGGAPSEEGGDLSEQADPR